MLVFDLKFYGVFHAVAHIVCRERNALRTRHSQANLEYLRDNHRKALKLLASCHGFQGAEEYSGPGEAVGPPYFNNMAS